MHADVGKVLHFELSQNLRQLEHLLMISFETAKYFLENFDFWSHYVFLVIANSEKKSVYNLKGEKT